MKKLLNTLFITTQGAYLSKKGSTVVVSHERETKLRIPVHNLDSIICFGNVMCSPFLMGLCGENNVPVSFLTERGRFLGRVNGPVKGNVLLRREQYRRADDMNISGIIARAIVMAKIANCRVVLQRAMRDKPDLQETNIPQVLRDLQDQIETLKSASNLDRIRGMEGIASNAYFGVFDHLITHNKQDFYFKERNRRPPLDNMNALLSFLYTLLVHDVTSALESVGLDPCVGFLHRDRPGRPSLALDIMEELRPYLADRLALSLINRQQIKPSGFTQTESGAVVMDEGTRKVVIVAWQKRKQEDIIHQFLQGKIKIGLLPYVQSLLLARFIRGDLEGYPPFFWK